MNTRPITNALDDRTVNVKVKLALLWVAVMFFYIYNDLFSLQQPGHLADLIEGQLEGVEITQGILFGGAVLMAIPSFMVFLSLTLKANVNRLVNVGVGIAHVLILIGTQFVGEGEVWLYWRMFELLEALFLALIAWTAWTWPPTETRDQKSDSVSASTYSEQH